jgi:tetratricopeptide (TPR) repeat protein
LYIGAGFPNVVKIVETMSGNFYQDLPLQMSTTAVHECISSAALPGWDATRSVGAVLLTLTVDKPYGVLSSVDDDRARSGYAATQRPAEDAERLEELFCLWKAAAWGAAISGRLADDPRSWQTLIVARLDELGAAAAQAAVEKWQEHAMIDPAWLSWINSLIRLTAEGRLRHASRRPLPTVGNEPFLGREHQAAELSGFLDRVQQGRGGIALVFGPAGIGKSRLLAEVLTNRAGEARVEWVQLDRGEAGYRGWRRLLGPLWVTLRRNELAPTDLLSHIDTLDDILLTGPEGGPAGKLLSGEIAEAVAALLDHIAARRCLILVIDDAQRGGASSDHLMVDVARRVSAGSIGIVAALRPDELEEGSLISDYIDQADGRFAPDIVVPVRLPPLDREATAGLLRKHVGFEPPAETVEHVLHQTAGRPQLILNTRIQVLANEAHPASWVAGRLEENGLLVLESTLQSRTAEARAVLEAAAICAIDRFIEPGVVAPVAGMPRARIERILDEEERRGTILSAQASGYRFQHDNWIDALIGSCPVARRRKLHAKWFRLLRPDPAADPQRLAQQAIGAGVGFVDTHDLVALTRRAARLAVADYAFGTATELYEVALRHATGRDRAELLIAYAETLWIQGRWDDARSQLKLAISHSEALKIPALEAEAVMLLQQLTWTHGHEYRELTPQIRNVLRRVPADEVTLRTQLQAALAKRLSLAERHYENEQADLARHALMELPRITDPMAQANILEGVHDGLIDSVPPGQLLELDEQQLALGTEIHSLHHTGRSLSQRIVDIIRAGRLLDLQPAVRAYHDFVERSAVSLDSYLEATIMGMLSLARADYPAAERYTNQAASLSAPWGGSGAHETLMGLSGWRLYETGQVDGLAEILEGLPEQDVHPFSHMTWALAAGLIRAERGEAEPAYRILHQICLSTSDLKSLPCGPARIGTIAAGAMLLGHPALRDRLPHDEASRIGHSFADLLDDHYDEQVVAGWPAVLLGSKQRFIGLAYLAAQDTEKAAEHLARAVEENRDFTALHVRSRFDLARALLCQDPGHPAALAEVKHVREDAVALGMKGLAAQAAARTSALKIPAADRGAFGSRQNPTHVCLELVRLRQRRRRRRCRYD